MPRRYALITPCRNEAEFARRTLDSVVAQTEAPALWLIVDDGSTDETPAILREYEEKHDFIRVLTRTDRGHRAVGPGVVEAFYAGFETIDQDAYDYVCKLDLDLDLPAGYFAELMNRMEADPRIATCSGKPYYPAEDGTLISEKCGDETSVGMTKFYRTEAFREIGGFVREVMWDGIDCHRCRMLGWRACSWDDPDLRFIHLRAMGSSQKGYFTGRLRHGFGQYFMGTGFVYMTAVSLFRMTRPPYLINGAGMWWGYVRSALKQTHRYDDPAFRRFLRAYQRQCLIKGKARATRDLDERQATVWQARRGEPANSN